MRWKKLKNSYTLISSLDIPYTYKHLWIELPLNCRQFSCIETRFIGIGLHRHDVNHDENLGIKSTMKCYRILWVIKYHPGSSTKDFSYSAIHKIAQQALPTGCFFTMGWNLFCKEHSHLYDKQKSSKKGGIFTECFHFGSNLPKNVSNHYPELCPRKDKMLRIVFGIFHGRLEPTWKAFWD